MGLISKKQIYKELKDLGIQKGDILNLKISMKSIGKVEGGAEMLIDTLLEIVGEEGTLITDSFVKTFPLFAKSFNKKNISNNETPSYAGLITNIMLKHQKSYRSNHPIQKFCAIGKLAKELTTNFTASSEPYGFLKKMAELDAKNLRIGGADKVVGVGTTHVAIEHFQYKQKRLGKGMFFLKDSNKKLFVENWADGCPVGFNNLLPAYKTNNCVLGESKVGNAESILTSMKKTLAFEIDLFQKEPDAFLCDDSSCINCSFNWEYSKNNAFSTFWKNLTKGNFKKAILVILITFFGKKYPITK